MPALHEPDAAGYLTIGGQSMNCPAWMIVDLTPLWIYAEVRGDDRMVSGLPGQIPYRRRLDVTRHDLRMVVIGDVDENGAAYGDAIVGLETNLDTLWANVISPTNVGDGTRAGILYMPSGATRFADIHVLRFEPTATYLDSYSAAMEGVLSISIPSGNFA